VINLFFNNHHKYHNVHKTLSNGQHVGMYIRKTKVRGLFSKHDNCNYEFYNIGLIIGKSRRQCNDWFYSRGKKNRKRIKGISTGNCGLEGLRFAFNEIKNLQQSLKKGEFILVGFTDNKRKSAYRYLKRIGFVLLNWGNKDYYYYEKQ
jgi:hypothetical protein